MSNLQLSSNLSMSSSCLRQTAFEELPDEILLLICRYFSSTDILFSLYGLNNRLTRTISGYFRQVVIAQIPYQRFQYICTSILPEIGSNIHSLVLSNQWKGILSKLFTNYFGDRMSSIFPQLKEIILISFSDYSLTSFLDSLENLPEFVQLNIYRQYQKTASKTESENLLRKLFRVNNNRLNSLLFDDDSMVFSFANKDHRIVYPHIRKLTIDLETINDLHRLLTVLPRIQSVNVVINKDAENSDEANEYLPIVTLEQFQLQSFGPSWDLDDLASILKRLPNVEELSITIEGNNDIRLTDGTEVYLLICNLKLRKFNYFLRFYNSTHLIDPAEILSSWEQFNQEVICFKNDEKSTLVLYTIPFVFSYLILRSSIAKNEMFIKNYASQVKMLTFCTSATSSVDPLSVIQKCYRLQCLNVRGKGSTLPKESKEIGFCRLAYLTKFTALRDSSVDTEFFQRLFQIAPNLHHLEIDYEFLKSCLDNEFICTFFKHRITHVYLSVLATTDIESVISSIPRFPSVFPFLRHIYFFFDQICSSCELLISTVLKCLAGWNCLISFGVVGVGLRQTIISKDPQQWVVDNSTLHDQNSFTVDFTDDTFRLWL